MTIYAYPAVGPGLCQIGKGALDVSRGQTKEGLTNLAVGTLSLLCSAYFARDEGTTILSILLSTATLSLTDLALKDELHFEDIFEQPPPSLPKIEPDHFRDDLTMLF